MENLENNKLIAEFMGFELQTNPKERWFGQYFTTPNEAWSNRIELLLFDTDWNWLMEVVKKIEELGNDVLITTNYIQIAFDEGEQFIVMEDFNIKITSVYDACIKFIKWYNENK
jgi:hypothetical protein